MFLIFNCHDQGVEYFYLFESVIESEAVKAMFQEFTDGYDVDEIPTREEFEDWLNELVKHGAIKPVNNWECFGINII